MMKTLASTLFILMLFLNVSCMAEKGSSTNKKKSVSSSVKNGTSNTPTTPVFANSESLYWFDSTKVTGTITVNKNTENVIYMRGQNIHEFLVSKDTNGDDYYKKTFCLEANFGGSYKKLKARAVPIFISNFNTKSIERILRIDLPSSAENSDACLATHIDNSAITDTAVFEIGSICSTCVGATLLTSTSLKLYSTKKNTTNYLTTISSTKLNLASLALRVDLLSNSTSSSSCTNSACEAKGFDCCIEGQCVKDATTKASASSEAQYLQAMSDYNTNPLSFINYPNIFNICTNISHTPPPTTGTTTTPLSEAEKRVQDYLSDYKCLDKVEKNEGYSLCLPGASESQYTAIKKKLAIACGCPSTYTDDERAIKCPDWGVRPLYKSTIESVDNIIDFYCYKPTPENPIGIITNLNVSVSSRSAPHRFYAEDGTNYDSLDKVATTVLQEGVDFYYLDETGKSSPINGAFNMNSILGRMNIGLSQTQPAKMVNVELGKTYILTATSGYFTPCSRCAKDSWFQTFSANPATSFGNGLIASGYTTSRNTYSANSTYGNYEDTKFGRACYLPATMIPFSHKKNGTLQTQRLNRLSTQSTFFVNGYQRDWFGFNKGALIGSFDGVSWFAVGTGRRVTANSSKLYLAINGSFLDLSDRTDTIVNIIPDMGGNVAPDFDYDPELTILDPRQNKAATCQQYHQCSTDVDCVTQLGWEYRCADISQMRTRWPAYDSDGKEILNQEKTGTLFEILQGTTTIGPSGKRCVYRGAGAPCVGNYTGMDLNYNKNALTCAPNFYCAALTSNKFNNEVARSINEFDNILFGMDANVLGRPLSYVGANKTLTAEIIANINNNATYETLGLNATNISTFGICRPGKSLASATALHAHYNADSSKRSDYISQIGTCDSTKSDFNRYRMCPSFDADNNYVQDDYTVPTSALNKNKLMQNSCGAEAKYPNDGSVNANLSAFKIIEGLSLGTSPIIAEATLAKDACLRRAGAVCHTDLDCGPNKMHENIVDTLSLKYFGGTEAEQSYWKESLICGQGTPVPTLGSSNYYDYKLSENRCCREIGKDFTMFTSGDSTVIPENAGSNTSLITSQLATTNPQATGRYSRYTISSTAQSSSTAIPAVISTSAPTANQWKVINETGSLTCCGGGWIRKFADGTHDWRIRNRLTLDAANFSCLNYRSPLTSPDYNGFGDSADKDHVVQVTYQKEFDYLCKFPANNGCMQVPYEDIIGFKIIPPYAYNPSTMGTLSPDYALSGDAGILPPSDHTRLDTSPTSDPIDGSSNWEQRLNNDVPYQPFPYYIKGTDGKPYDTDVQNNNKAYNFFTNKTFDYGVSIYLPAYIPYNASVGTVSTVPTINKIYIKYFYDKNPIGETVDITSKYVGKASCNNVTTFNGVGMPINKIESGDPEAWCVSHNTTTGGRPVLNIKADTSAGNDWKYAGIIIDFKPIEFATTELGKSTTAPTPAKPGTPYYYLTKLGRLELIGIPQIVYEPLYCTDNQKTLVPGIFKSSIATRSDYLAQSNENTLYNFVSIYDDEGGSVSDTTAGYGNGEKRFSYQDKLDHSAIFSAKDFTCCTPLGKEVASGTKCCSGNAQTGANGKLFCKLPRGTDLNVYFNKFVSSEGVGDDQPGGGLIITRSTGATNDNEVDFNAYTGEPKMRASTFAKLEALGRAYCTNGVVGTGAAFGKFPPEPFSGSYMTTGNSGNIEDSFPLSIVDSIIDSDPSNVDAGKMPFDIGYRWNHHYYCK